MGNLFRGGKFGAFEGSGYPMPCPGCGKIIRAQDRLCPYCGIDSDAKLWPLRAAVPFIAVGLMIGVGYLIRFFF
jgi:hypothetical protein